MDARICDNCSTTLTRDPFFSEIGIQKSTCGLCGEKFVWNQAKKLNCSQQQQTQSENTFNVFAYGKNVAIHVTPNPSVKELLEAVADEFGFGHKFNGLRVLLNGSVLLRHCNTNSLQEAGLTSTSTLHLVLHDISKTECDFCACDCHCSCD
tara:strand:+ start:2175 stop:2627 length:453 start_codon:yes stop_codon:yes gene_type:complete